MDHQYRNEFSDDGVFLYEHTVESGANAARRTTRAEAEDDVVYGKGIYCYLKRAGVRAWWKRTMRRRERHERRHGLPGEW